MFDTSHIAISEYVDGDAFERIPDTTYIKTDYVRAVLESRSVSGVLVTHNSDLGINADLATFVFERSPGVTCWFGQNVLIRHPKLVPIPIGLERTRWFPRLYKREQLHEATKRSMETPTGLCLANFSLHTNKTERGRCLDKASSFATLQVVDCVGQDSYQSYARYLEEILRHKFVLCPAGNGVDTHRVWEALYCGRIPVVTKSPTMGACASLPMVVLDSWDDLARAKLENCWETFRSGQVNYNLDALFMSYWAGRITGVAPTRDL